MVWIEMYMRNEGGYGCRSPPARVVWIEMLLRDSIENTGIKSPPARVVWIEMADLYESYDTLQVATREGGVD